MISYLIGLLALVGVFCGMLLMMETGRRLRGRRGPDPDAEAGLGNVQGAIFGLAGLLIAFTFSGAASRFEARRQLLVEEANAIGTAYLRLDLLPAASQDQLRADFRAYVDKRLAIYRALPDIDSAKSLLAESVDLQNKIWQQAVAACRQQQVNGNAVTSLVMASLNDMIDITTTRTVALKTHPPAMIFVTLAVMVLAGALFVGYGLGSRQWWSRLHTIGYAMLLTFALYVIVDLEFPRMGMMQISSLDQLLVDVRQSMK